MTRGRTVISREQRKTRREGNTIRTHSTDYYGKTPESRDKQLANLRQNSGKSKPKDPNAPARPKIADLKTCDIITFATEYLGVSFAERPAQEVILRSLYGLPLDEAQVALYHKLTGNSEGEVFEADVEKTEGNFNIGARGGKSLMTAIVALFESIVKEDYWKRYLMPGETGYAIITATRQKQAEAIIQKSCTRLLQNSLLSHYIEQGGELLSELRLTNGLIIGSYPCNNTSARGLPIYLLMFDEMAWYRTQGVKADETIFEALDPRRGQFPGAKCLKISTPRGKQGLFWKEFDEGFRVPGRLTIKADTRLVNPLYPQAFIDKAYKRNPDYARMEYGAEFAETLEGFFISCIDKLRACFDFPDEDIPYQQSQRYFASIDQAGLTGNDLFAFSIAHNESKTHKITLDVVREWDTKDIDVIKEHIKALCSTYKIHKVRIDRYGAGLVKSILENIGLTVEVRDLLPVIYVNFRTLVLSDKLSLPFRSSLRDGLILTQALYGKSQSMTIHHDRMSEGSHGDLADSVCDSAYQASQDLTVHDLQPVFAGAEDDGWDEWRD